MSSESDKIKQLLLADELALLQQLRARILESDRFSEEVAQVLAKATGRAWKNDPAYRAVLAKPIGDGLKTALKREQRTIIDAFVPVIGPMIRASVSASIKKLMADINRVLELGLSPKALRWRWQAWKTGVPFAELVFMNTVEYQVQHVFLIDKNSGLLIEYAGHEEELARDKDAFSAMLTAIGDFVSDTLASDSGKRLRSAELGEYQLWIIDGPQAYLAVLIKGSPSERLRDQLQDVLDKVHFLYTDELQHSENYGNLPPVRLELEDLLVTKSRQQDDDKAGETSSTTRWLWLLGILVLAFGGWFWWHHHQQEQTLQSLKTRLQQVPGFVLQTIRDTENGLEVTGLKDPLADLGAFADEGLKFNTRPYLSLDAPIVRQRLQRLTLPAGLSLELADNGQVFLRGEARPEAVNRLEKQLLAMPGVAAVDSHQVKNTAARWQDFRREHSLPSGVQAQFDEQQLRLSGQATASNLSSWLATFQQAFPDHQINTEAVRRLLGNKEHIQAINDTFVAMPDGATLNPSAMAALDAAAAHLAALKKTDPTVKIRLSGHTDCTGSPETNQRLANQRAQRVREALIQRGLAPEAVVIEAQPCTGHTPQHADPSRRGVAMNVIPAPEHPGGDGTGTEAQQRP